MTIPALGHWLMPVTEQRLGKQDRLGEDGNWFETHWAEAPADIGVEMLALWVQVERSSVVQAGAWVILIKMNEASRRSVDYSFSKSFRDLEWNRIFITLCDLGRCGDGDREITFPPF